MAVKKKILSLLSKHQALSGGKLAKLLGMSRQALSRHLTALKGQGAIRKSGSTKAATYYLSTWAPFFSKKFRLSRLNEDRVFREHIKPLLTLNKKALDIYQYAFTEMLNNAIDHSNSESCTIYVYRSPTQVAFRICDQGVGIFNKIRRAKKLPDDLNAIEEMMKGKCTTDPERHTGEGIFFTSKAVDRFLCESSRVALEIDNRKKDYAIHKSPYGKGTSIYVEIGRKTQQTLSKLFDDYSQDYRFSKTKIYIKLFERGETFVSRSEAKRLLKGLEKFDEITLDFKRVKAIGQGFSDEVFRVFQNSNSRISIKVVNAQQTILFMIRRSRR